MTDQFTVTITSQTECVFKDSNRRGKFRAHLGRSVELRGNWSVALFEIFYPVSYPNLREEVASIICTYSDGSEVFHLRPGYYRDADRLKEELNQLMLGHFKITLDPAKVVTIKFSEDARYQTYTFSEQLMNILGFEQFETLLGVGELRGNYPCDTRRGFPQLFSIESDIITEQCVNSEHRKNLRTFAPSSNSNGYGLLASKEFDKLLFLPVGKTSLESIDFHITDELRREVSFAHGSLTVVLVFKRSGYGF